MEQTVDFRAIPEKWRIRLKQNRKRYRSPYELSPIMIDARGL
jgi:hypothetical protein